MSDQHVSFRTRARRIGALAGVGRPSALVIIGSALPLEEGPAARMTRQRQCIPATRRGLAGERRYAGTGAGGFGGGASAGDVSTARPYNSR